MECGFTYKVTSKYELKKNKKCKEFVNILHAVIISTIQYDKDSPFNISKLF